MKENNAKRRFREAVDGAFIRENYPTMRNDVLARKMGLTVRQVENYVYRCGKVDWAHKQPSVLSLVNSENGKRGGRPRKVKKNKANTFFISPFILYFVCRSPAGLPRARRRY